MEKKSIPEIEDILSKIIKGRQTGLLINIVKIKSWKGDLQKKDSTNVGGIGDLDISKKAKLGNSKTFILFFK